MKLEDSYLLRISRPVAIDFLKHFEHLGNIGLGVWHWGLFKRNKIMSVVSYGTVCFSNKRGFLSEIAQKFGCNIIQICRGASTPWSPKGAASRLISLANKEMYKLKGPLLIVAYSDEKLCEIGTIYQACNAIYTGMTSPKGQANYIINGEKLSGWQVRKRYGTRKKSVLYKIDPKYEIFPLHKKHRYIMVAGSPRFRSCLRKTLELFTMPYPKREENSDFNVIGEKSFKKVISMKN